MLKPGDDVDSWCGTCKLVLAHTVEALVGKTPARVHCNTCGAQHKYKPEKPVPRAKDSGGRKKAPPGLTAQARSYRKLLDGKDMSQSRRYSSQDTYVPGEVVEHPRFGIGVTTAIQGDRKVEIAFEDGVRMFLHRQ